jgi:hypothetical protein
VGRYLGVGELIINSCIEPKLLKQGSSIVLVSLPPLHEPDILRADDPSIPRGRAFATILPLKVPLAAPQSLTPDGPKPPLTCRAPLRNRTVDLLLTMETLCRLS